MSRRVRGRPGARGVFTLRAATLADAPACARVMRAAIRGLARGAVPPRALEAWASLPALYHRWAMTAGGERYLVAERAGRVAGYAALRVRAGRLGRAELTACFVHPRHARRGLGAALVARLAARARRAGHPSLVAVAAPGAVPFYAALGFRAGRAVRVPLPGGLALRATSMRLGSAKRAPSPGASAPRAGVARGGGAG